MAKRSGSLVLIALTVVLAAPAYWLLFSTLMAHDDEGYVLISLKNYALYGGLYTRVFSQYGPFFYFFHDISHRLLNYEFTNTTARFLTLGCWLLASLAGAQLVWRQTRNVWFSVTALVATFVYLHLMVSEPGHPGGLISALIAVAVLVGAGFIERGSIHGLAITASLATASLLLIKVNVGLFFGLSVSAWFVLHLPRTHHARVGSAVVTTLLCLLPLALMKSEFHEAWALQFAGLSVVASLTVIMTGWTIRQPLSEWKFALHGLISAAVFVAGVTIAVSLRGTSFQTMWAGIVLNPLRQPGIYHFAPDWKPESVLSAILSAIIALFYVFNPGRFPRGPIIAIRLITAFSLGLAACHWFPFSYHSSVMSYVIPWGWTMIIPLMKDETRTTASVRLWVGLVLMLQYLHAYPVAGSQIAWGTFYAIPLVALGLHDAWVFCASRKIAGPVWTALILTTSAFAIGAVQLGARGWQLYHESVALALPGAENIRPPRSFASALRVLAVNAKTHGDMLFSLPGMFSFNLWTGLPTPTLNNTTHWFTLLEESQLREIAGALANDDRPVVIVHQGMLKFLADSHFPVDSSLSDFLSRNFVRSFRVDDLEFWVRQGRKIVPVNTARFLPLPNLVGRNHAKLELIIELPPRETAARIELVTLTDSPTVLTQWDQTNAQFDFTTISPNGELIPPNAGLNNTTQLIRLDVESTDTRVPDPRYSMVFIKNAAGHKIAEARFVE